MAGTQTSHALLLGQAQDAIAFERERADKAEAEVAKARATIAAARDGIAVFLSHYGASEILMHKVAIGLANATLRALDPGDGTALNDGRPVTWSNACEPGGMVCAVLNPGRPDGICGTPVESEPCNEHGKVFCV